MAKLILDESEGAFTVVALRGRLDAAGCDEVGVALTSQIVARRKPAVLDLNEVTFMASIGVGMLVTIAKSMRGHGIGMALVVGQTPVRHVLEITNIATLIPIVSTREEALRTLGVS